MKDSQEALEAQLSPFFDVHLSRLKCLSRIILGLIQLRTVNLAELALILNPSVAFSSNYKRLQRFFRFFDFPFDSLSKMLWSLFDEGDLPVLSLDRTNWKLGRRNINILMLSLCYQGVGIPIMWSVLKDKRGNSSTAERIELMERFMRVIAPPYLIRLVADREFISTAWLEWLDSNHIHYVIRIRKNQYISLDHRKEKQAWQFFTAEHFRLFRKPRLMNGLAVYIGGKKLPDGDFLILISNLPIKTGLAYYKRRWEIEILFANLKTRGFNFESTHLTHKERIATLTATLAIALAWAVKVGSWITRKGKDIPIKKHGRKEKSIFRSGLDYIRTKILNNKDLSDTIRKLSCT